MFKREKKELKKAFKKSLETQYKHLHPTELTPKAIEKRIKIVSSWGKGNWEKN